MKNLKIKDFTKLSATSLGWRCFLYNLDYLDLKRAVK